MDKCSICNKPLNSKDSKNIRAPCGHTFHRQCVQDRFEKQEKIKCKTCKKYWDVSDVCKEKTSTVSSTGETYFSYQDQTHEHGGNRGLVASTQPVAHDYASNQSGKKPSPQTRPGSATIRDQSSSSSSERASPSRTPSYADDDHRGTMPSTKASKDHRRKTVVYIPELPRTIEDLSQFKQDVRHYIKKTVEIDVDDVQCFPNFGFGIIHGVDEKTKCYLVEEVRQIRLQMGNENMTISFSDTLELISYIVLNKQDQRKNSIFPTPEELSSQWIKHYAGQKPLSCSQLDIQFPNIHRVVSGFSDRLLTNPPMDNCSISGISSQIYYCADCSFLKNLPTSVTQEDLEGAIRRDIKEQNVPSLHLYTQINKQTRNACVIVTGRARKWTTKSHIYLDNNRITKETNLICRLLIYPVPRNFDINRIINDGIFAGNVTAHERKDENLILTVPHKNTIDECLKYKAFRIDEEMFSVKVYDESRNVEGCEIDADTWYKTKMTQVKSDIMQFVVDPKHFIFNYQWNQKIWLDEFQNSAPQSHANGNNHITPRSEKSSKPDQTRHLLRMTVMLNTIGVVWKKSYLIGDREIKLNLDDKLKTIVYNHQSKLEQCDKIPQHKIKYSQTNIEVLQKDCLVAYKDLVKDDYRPLLLNMANLTTPGGGYKKGDGAQEENIFRRSDYFRSLDMELDQYHNQRAERFLCTSNCQLEPILDQKRIYPMDEFGAIYTSGLTVFRQPEETGYAYMKHPLENVCAIAMAAYRDPQLEDNKLAPKYAVGMRKKIENIFSIAYHHDHDSLVLSAFGCGAFKNPPEHVAQLFGSVIEQYAGFFKLIVFAIIDDHNTGRHLNREGNFKPFERLFKQTVYPVEPMGIPNTMIGPYRLLSDGCTVSDVCIFESMPCQHGATCNTRDPDHARNFSHPPLCTILSRDGKCPRSSDKVHMQSFIHRNRCRDGGECRDIDNEKHRQEFEHPSFCSDGNTCVKMDRTHLQEYRHLPLCPESLKCKDYQKKVKLHCDTFRHCLPICPFGNNCNKFHDEKHINECQHPFYQPCPFTPYHCPFHNKLSQQQLKNGSFSHDDEQHFLQFSHVCANGRNCTNTSAQHAEKFIHIARKICSFDDKCSKLDQEDHLNSFTHTNIPDIRSLCTTKNCNYRTKRSHNNCYRHHILGEDVKLVVCHDLNVNINFVQNQKDSIARINDYFKNSPRSSITLPNDILKWFRIVQPVYRCNQIMFELILFHQQVMSQDYMKNFREPNFVADLVLQHNRIRCIDVLKQNSVKNYVKEYIIALVEEEYASHISQDSSSASTLTHVRRTKEKNLLQSISKDDISILKETVKFVTELYGELRSKMIDNTRTSNQFVDQEKTIYSILGPHLGHYYGDIFIVFKREILHHPDANLSIQSAMSFVDGEVFQRCPWFDSDPHTNDERIQEYHKSKLHASVPGYEYAAALEWIATVRCCNKKNPLNIDLETILREWPRTNTYKGVEANLPGLIPISYIDRVYIPENILNSLHPDSRQMTDTFFKDRIVSVSCIRNAGSSMTSRGTTSQSISQVGCQDFIIDQLNTRFSHHDEDSIARPIQGFIFTIPSSKFSTHLLLPLTISQAFAQYRTDRTQSSKDNTTIIYWQAMNGDMMVTLSSDKSDFGKTPMNSRSFICYIAKKPATDSDSYHEDTSYLDSGSPLEHDIHVRNGTYAAGSNTFYVGSNTDDFMTFCLKIQRSTGKITLSHAGPNSLYNHTTISYTFGKTELDLVTLEFIRVSAGERSVPIRNMMICFEEQPDLHPKLDANIKKDSNFNEGESSGKQVKQRHRKNDSSSSFTSDDEPSNPAEVFSKRQDSFSDNHSSSLIPCPDNINCLRQLLSNEKAHNSKYSHPCRFSELCRNPEPTLTHEPHRVPICHKDTNCKKLTDPTHRAEYRHTGLPDYLIPCRFQQGCSDKSDKHRMKYSHGEQVFKIFSSGAGRGNMGDKSTQPARNQERNITGQMLCKWGLQCREMNNAQHCQKYSHLAPGSQRQNNSFMSTKRFNNE